MMLKNLSAILIRMVLVTMLAIAPAPAMAQNGAFKRIDSLEFRDSSVGEAIRLIARLSGVNVFATREASSREFSMTVSDTDVRGVIASIARVTGLSFSYDEQSSAFIIMTNKQFSSDVVISRNAETKVFTLRHQNVVAAAKVVKSLFGDRVALTIDTSDPDRLEISDDDLQSSRSTSSNSTSSDSNSSSSSGTNTGDFNASDIDPRRLQELVGNSNGSANLTLSELTKRLGLEPEIYVTINREHNLLYVRTSDRDALRDIEKIIKQTDRPTKQVLLEVRIMSLKLDDDFRSSFDFGLNSGGTKDYSSDDSGLFFQFLSKNILSQINMLEAQNRAETLSTPMLSASNNSPARLFVGTEALLARGFSTNTTTGTSGSSTTNTTTDVELREVGQSLEILPRINADDTVTLVIQQENSTVVEGGGIVPIVTSTGAVKQVSVDTVDTARVGGTVTAKTGTTIAVGGLIRDGKARGSRKVPVLGNVPLLGLMFRGDTSSKERTELILMITPHIYSGGPEGERLARARLARNSRNAAIDSEVFGGTENGVPAVTLRGQQQQFVPMTRFAAAMRHGVKPADKGVYRGFDVAPINSGGALRSGGGGGGLKLFGNSAITAEAAESWRKRNLYVTAVVLTNVSEGPQPIQMGNLRGAWLAATPEAKMLKPRNKAGSRAYVYLISDRPYDDVIADLRVGGGL